MDSRPQKIGQMMIFLLLFVASLADLFSLIPLVGILVGPLFWLLVALYLWKKGYGLLNLRMIAPMGVSAIGEILPAIQEFPTILGGIIAVIILARIQEKTGISIASLAKGKIPKSLNSGGVRRPTPPPLPASRQPLNIDGVRAPQKS